MLRAVRSAALNINFVRHVLAKRYCNPKSFVRRGCVGTAPTQGFHMGILLARKLGGHPATHILVLSIDSSPPIRRIVEVSFYLWAFIFLSFFGIFLKIWFIS
jgi:hypothetical protein